MLTLDLHRFERVELRPLASHVLEDRVVVQRALQAYGVEGVHERAEAGVHLPGVGIVWRLFPAHEGHESYTDKVPPEILERRAHRTVVDDDCGMK